MYNAYMYILKCSDNSYYTGSTKNIELRLKQHQNGEGSNHTRKRLPVKLVYYEGFDRIDDAFYREKQIQGWSRAKKEALMAKDFDKLRILSKNHTQNNVPSASSGTASAVSANVSESSGTASDSVVVPVCSVVEPAETNRKRRGNTGVDVNKLKI